MSTIRGPRIPQLLGAVLLFLALLPGPARADAAVVSAVALSGARSTAAAPLPAALAWGWPLAGAPQVAHPFDGPAQPWLSGHRGVDLSAEQGVPVLAQVGAVVTFSGVVVNRPVLTLAAANGLRLSFEPVVSPLRAGEPVTRGQVVGVVSGPTHCDEAGPGRNSCLHWGVRRGEDYVDPLQFILDLRPSVLLPPIDELGGRGS